MSLAGGRAGGGLGAQVGWWVPVGGCPLPPLFLETWGETHKPEGCPHALSALGSQPEPP